MYIFTAKLSKKRRVFIIVLLALIVISTVLPRFIGASAASVDNGSSNEKRISFLNTLGWQVNQVPENEQEIIIPAEFNDVYNKYNKLQLSCGYDLSRYHGLKATRYTYLITNYPEENCRVCAELLVIDGEIIGGDIHSLDLGGFMYGLKKVQP